MPTNVHDKIVFPQGVVVAPITGQYHHDGIGHPIWCRTTEEKSPCQRAYLRTADTSVEDVRRRARRATSGELNRRTRQREDPLLVRQVGPNGLHTTALEPIKAVAESRDEITTRPVTRP
jgi:hypothetical protein